MEDPLTGQGSTRCEKQKMSTHLLLSEMFKDRFVKTKNPRNAVKNTQLSKDACQKGQVDRDSYI